METKKVRIVGSDDRDNSTCYGVNHVVIFNAAQESVHVINLDKTVALLILPNDSQYSKEREPIEINEHTFLNDLREVIRKHLHDNKVKNQEK